MADDQIPPAPPHITVRTLGAARITVERDDAPPSTLSAGKPLALLVYLSSIPGHEATRDHLVDLLWSDVESEAGRHALRQTVWYLRQRVFDSILSPTRSSVRLNRPLPTDRAAFTDAVERGDVEAAVSLYEGDFLPSMGLPGGLEFEQWADVERHRLRHLFLRSAEIVVRRRLETGQHRSAVALARRARDADRNSEAAWRLLLEALISAGDALGASTEANALSNFLTTEEREPEPATRTLIRTALAGPNAALGEAKPRGLSTELIGRAQEFAVLVSTWEEVRGGRASHVHVAAPAGVGKTRLISDFAARLRARRSRLAMVSLRYGDRSIPQAALGKIAAAIAELPGAAAISPASARALVALHPPLSSVFPVSPDDSQGSEALRRRSAALQELIGAVCHEGAVALVIDDLHWMDEMSSRAIASVLQHLEAERLFVVTTSRPRYALPLSRVTVTLELAPLTPGHVAGLVASLGALPNATWASDFAERLHRATDGVPLHVLETLQLLVERQDLRLEGETWSAPEPTRIDTVLVAGTALRDRLRALSKQEREMLVVVAVAGVPVETSTIASVLEVDRPTIDAAASQLEQHGLLISTSDGWRQSHDAIAESILTLTSTEEQRRINRALGTVYSSAASGGEESLLRGARHFAQAEDEDAVTRIFVRWLSAARRHDDGRPTRELASEFLGGDVSHGITASSLASDAPLMLRLPRSRLRGFAASGALGMLLAFFVANRATPSAKPVEATLLATFTDPADSSKAIALDLRLSDLVTATDLQLKDGRPVDWHEFNHNSPLTLSPDGRQWVFERVYPDEGGIELVTRDVTSGKERRITNSHGDDFNPSWSPDGKRLVFATGRFDARSHSDIATIDLATGKMTQLTSGGESDGGPIWSPSGTQIAFGRRYWGPSPTALCTMGADGSAVSCAPLDGTMLLAAMGWFDDHRVIVLTQDSAKSALVTVGAYDLRTRELRRLYRGSISDASISPDGHWFACRCAASENLNQRWMILPISNSGAIKEVVLDRLGDQDFRIRWIGPPRQNHYAVALRVVAPQQPLPTDVPLQMRATAVDKDGRTVEAGVLRWRGLDPAVAQIDSITGVLTASREGHVRIIATFGGWVSSETTTVLVRNRPATLLLNDDWSAGLRKRFVPFGVPSPDTVTTRELGLAMRTNGDGSFVSGVYSRQTFPAANGLAVEATVSTPIDSLQWQELSIGLMPDEDSVSLAKWDHRTGTPALLTRRTSDGGCSLGIPASEGYQDSRDIAIGGLTFVRTRVDDVYRSGRPYRILLQLFPDGRCSASLNGRIVGSAPGTTLSRAGYRLVLYGNSVDTQISVGPIAMWSGIRMQPQGASPRAIR